MHTCLKLETPKLATCTPDNLKVMLIDEAPERSESMADLLKAAGCQVIACVSPGHDLLEQIEKVKPDLVIIDIELPDRDIMENLQSVQASTPRPMVMFSQDEQGYTIRRAIEAGVSAYVVDGIDAARVRPVIDAAIATFDRYQLLHKRLEVTQSELDKRDKVESAKRIIMEQRGVDDAEAYKIIRRTAMDQRVKVIDIAERIIDAARLLCG